MWRSATRLRRRPLVSCEARRPCSDALARRRPCGPRRVRGADATIRVPLSACPAGCQFWQRLQQYQHQSLRHQKWPRVCTKRKEKKELIGTVSAPEEGEEGEEGVGAVSQGRMDRDVERGEEEGGESFYDCVLEIEENADPQDFLQETAVVQDPQHPTVNGEMRALPGLMGNDLKSASRIFSVVAATVGLGLLLAFLGLTLTPTASLMHSASTSSCRATTDDVARLYMRVGVGLVIAVTQFIASRLGASGKETAEPRVPVMRRVCVFVAALSQLGLTVSVFWSLILALSLRLGQMRCWPQVTRDLLLTGTGIASALSTYLVYIGLACVFGTS